ncbi:MAG: NAD(P)H-dependent oxidoreductase [Akkermansiaceae bacterium]|nr:NAD(P)H-dependent oxidoreductase [Akkermansiaceae bacterium]
MSLSPDATLDALKWRYATKQFDPERKIPADAWDAIEESLVLTPSSFGLQPWKFIVVEREELRQQLLAESWNQSQVTDASHFVVLTARTDLTKADIERWIDCMAGIQEKSPEDYAPLKGMIAGFSERMSQRERKEWNIRQSYIALGQLMAVAAVMGIDACPMEGISVSAYDRLLGLENSDYATVVACALGYRAEDDKYASSPKARYPREEVIERK